MSALNLPPELQTGLADLLSGLPRDLSDFLNTNDSQKQAFLTACAYSDFIKSLVLSQPEMVLAILQSDELAINKSGQDYYDQLSKRLENVSDEADLHRALRQYRQQEMFRIAWRDLNKQQKLQDTMSQCSGLADAAISLSLAKLHQWQAEKEAPPLDKHGRKQALIIIAVGKLGSQELNFSSDIDLIFAYPESGESFFTLLARQLIRCLQLVTEDGFVFRVDMRLRPYGDSGPLVMSFSQMASYYQEQGRDWERYALLKGRIISGSEAQKSQLNATLKPFIYRKYIDYGSIDALRSMKQLIAREVRIKDMQNDIKRGPGGIREIEFIGQVFQLIRGGQDRRLQQRKILSVLRYLKASKTLDANIVDELSTAYIFLRNVEHRLQMVADKQTHALPNEDEAKLRLAHAMGFSDWEAFFTALETHRQHVEHHFEQMLVAPEHEETQGGEYLRIDCHALWMEKTDASKSLKILHSIGFEHADAVLSKLMDFKHSYRCRQMDATAQQRLDNLLPIVLALIGKTANPEVTLERMIHLLDSILRRSVYMVLLLENPKTLKWLVKLFDLSDWVADHIARYPSLLEELLNAKPMLQAVSASELEDELRQTLLSIPEEDLEGQMEALRLFKQRQVLKVAASDLENQLPLMKVSDHLTFTAQTILRQVQELAGKEVTFKHADLEQPHFENQFAIIAYGKLGGIELSYSSDVDLVFLHDNPPGNDEFTIRLAKRIIHMLSTRMSNGILYKVDTRLRPSGSAGLMVSGIDAFIDYQKNSAWTWEHQALVRARVISGPEEMVRKFDACRAEILSSRRDLDELRQQVSEMRLKMKESHEVKETDSFDVKQGDGGIADIEFLVQFAVLAWSADYPSLMKWPDNIRILETIADEGLIEAEDVSALIDAYQDYRAIIHNATLRGTSTLVSDDSFVPYRELINRLWNEVIRAAQS